MNQQSVIKSQEELLRDAFEQWRVHPVTQFILNKTRELRDKQLEKSVMNAHNTELPDVTFRLNACSARSIDAVIKLMTEFEATINK